MYWDYYLMGIILIPGLIFAAIAQGKVNRAYSTYSKVLSKSGKTAAEVARLILDTAGCTNIAVVKISGHLSDHFDPKKKRIALSNSVHDSTSVAALGIAAHEVGHAIQNKQNYLPLKLRSLLIPITNLSSVLLWPLIIIGLVFNFAAMPGSIVGDVFLWIGVAFFGISVLLNLITLPVEYNASRRAAKILSNSQILDEKETMGAKKVLNAAALTYVAALLVSVLNLLRFLISFFLASRD